MQFFTRQNFDLFQVHDPSSEIDYMKWYHQTQWGIAGRDYETYLNSISLRLSDNAIRVAKLLIHDFKVLDIASVEDGIRLKLGSPWKKPWFTTGYILNFQGEVMSTSNAVGQGIIVHELSISDSNDSYGLRFDALLDRTELAIRFREVLVEDWAQS